MTPQQVVEHASVEDRLDLYVAVYALGLTTMGAVKQHGLNKLVQYGRTIGVSVNASALNQMRSLGETYWLNITR